MTVCPTVKRFFAADDGLGLRDRATTVTLTGTRYEMGEREASGQASGLTATGRAILYELEAQ